MVNFGHLAVRNGKIFGNKLAFIDGGRRVDWKTLDERTDRIAHFLVEAGVVSGDRVASFSCDCLELVEVVIACAKIGAVRVGINHRFAVPEVEHILRDSDAKVLFYQGVLEQSVRQAVRNCRHDLVLVGFEGAEHCNYNYEALIDCEGEGALSHVYDLDHVGYIFYSSGSTGRPKGVMLSFRQVMDSIAHTALNEGSGRSDVWLHTMPAGGAPLLILMRPMYHGATCVIMRRWDAVEALRLIEQEKVTRTLLVPTMLVSIIHHSEVKNFDLSSLKQIAYGSAPCTPANIRRTQELLGDGIELLQMYGATEITGMATMLFPEDHRRAIEEGKHEILASVGRQLPYVEIQLLGEDGREVEVGEVGEVCVRSQNNMKGYINLPDVTAETLRDGWVHTGDMGKFDEEGYLYLVDRKKFMIVTGGFNVFPIEVENAISQHPAVKEVAVFGVPDDFYGESVKAVVTLRDGMTATESDIISECRKHIAGYKVPKSVDFRRDMPRNAVGKLDKRALKDSYQKAEPVS